MRACKKYRALIGAYVDDVASEAECDEVRAHLSACPACAREVSELRRTRALLTSLPALRPSPGLKTSIAAKLREQRVGWLERLFWAFRPADLRLPVAVAALLLICLGLGVFTLHSLRPEALPATSVAGSIVVYSPPATVLPEAPLDEYTRSCELAHGSLDQDRAYWGADATVLTSYPR